MRSWFLSGLGLFGLLLLAALAARAERFPVKTYTTADGLLRDQVIRNKQDSRGFLWFCTAPAVPAAFRSRNFIACDVAVRMAAG